MKIKLFIIISLIFLSASGIKAQEIHWLSPAQLEQKMQLEAKPIYVFIFTQNCSWCKKMKATTLQNKDIINTLNSTYYCLKIDGSKKTDIHFNGKNYRYDYTYSKRRAGAHSLVLELEQGYPVYPASVFLSPEYDILYVKKGSSNIENFKALLNWFE